MFLAYPKRDVWLIIYEFVASAWAELAIDGIPPTSNNHCPYGRDPVSAAKSRSADFSTLILSARATDLSLCIHM